MKYFKKFVAAAAALALALCMGTTAFAAGEGSITVENPVAGQTYTAYKIFDVTYDEAKSTYSYSMKADSEWLTTVKNYKGVTVTESTDGNYVVTKNDNFSAVDFSKDLSEAVAEKTGIALTVADDKATATGLDLGYYFVTSTTGTLCNLTTTDPAATIYDKNDVPFDKVDDDDSVEVGQTVHYTITGKVPDTTGFATYTYKITDVMSAGLTFNKDVKVFIGDTEISNLTVVYADNGFELDIPVVNYQKQIGAKIEVKYSAVVNAGAVAKVENNKAQLEYTNGPNSSTTTKPVEQTVYTAKIVIDKFAANNESLKLAGAKFVLINNDTVDGDGDGIANDANTGKFYKVDEYGDVSWVDDLTKATVVTTDENGIAEFAGLEDGTYLLREIEAPAGYNMLTKDVEVVIPDNSFAQVKTLSVEADVANNSGTELPSTGGMGTTLMYALGAVLVLGAGIGLVVKRRMNASK